MDIVNQKWMHTMVTQVLRSSNKWFSTYISRIFGFHSRLKLEKAKSEKVYTPVSSTTSFFYTSVKRSYQSLDKYIHRLNRRYLKLTSVQLSRMLVFQGVSRLYTPVKPTIFEINIGAIVQNVGFPRVFQGYIHRLNRRYLKLTSVQLSRTLVFPGISRLHSPIKPTIFEINIGAIVQ